MNVIRAAQAGQGGPVSIACINMATVDLGVPFDKLTAALQKWTKDGQPVSKVFVKTTLADHQLVSVTASHELFEMAIDPIANLWAEAADGTEYAYEMSDPVEEDTFPVDGIQMSNIVHPAWFEPFKHPPGTKYDHLGLVAKPYGMTKGGYVIIKKKGKVSQVYGSKAKEKRFAREDRLGHRSEYRKPNGRRIPKRRRPAPGKR